ncbi:MAG: DUF4157 domain-containing protein [Candidatus Scalindua sp.]|nr:DUF4157 domain-containing protein [Candidatus Scalindua sp.]
MPAQLTQTNKKSNFTPAAEPSISMKSEDDTLHEEHPQNDTALQMQSFFRASNGETPPGSGDGDNKLNNSSLFGYLKVQPKLTIGQPNDKYEQEADTVADKIIMMPSPGNSDIQMSPSADMTGLQMMADSSNPEIQMKCEECEMEEDSIPSILPKLEIGVPNDQYEKEADAVADKVMMSPNPEPDDFSIAPSPGSPTDKISSLSDTNTLQTKCKECEEEENEMGIEPQIQKSMVAGIGDDEDDKVQMKSAIQKSGNSKTNTSLEIAEQINNTKGKGHPLPESTNRELSRKIGSDFSDVRIHNDSNAVQLSKGLVARAFAYGSDIYFNKDQYNPYSRDGKHLLTHELTHSVQQGSVESKSIDKKCKRTVQKRRLPASSDIRSLLATPVTADNRRAHRVGLRLAISRSLRNLNLDQRADVNRRLARYDHDLDIDTALASTDRAVLRQLNTAVRAQRPNVIPLGDPDLIEVGPATSTQRSNLRALVSRTALLFKNVLDPANRVNLEEVFGTSQVAEIQSRYTAGRTRMRELHTDNRIYTDRSGFSSEVHIDGSTDMDSINLDSEIIDSPTLATSIVTMLHEAMHAGNSEVTDAGGYLGSPNFVSASELVKKNTAAYYEVPANRLLNEDYVYSYTGIVFEPATVGGVLTLTPTPTPTLTPAQEGARKAYDWLNAADARANNIYVQGLDHIYKNPHDWDTVAESGVRFSETLPYWSKVQNLTIHRRTIVASSTHARPVTLIDLSLAEGFIRNLARASSRWSIPNSHMHIIAYENRHLQTTDSVRGVLDSSPSDSDAHADAILLIQLRRAWPLTMVDHDSRDIEVVKALARRGPMFPLFPRLNPSDFPY